MGEQLNVKVSSLKLKKMMLTALLAVGFIATATASAQQGVTQYPSLSSAMW